MSDFLLDFQQYAAARGYRIYRVAQIYREEASAAELLPVCPCLNSYSISKLFTATAIGILQDDGLLSVEDKVCDLLGDLCPAGTQEAYRTMTIDMALRHSIGLPAGYLDIDLNPPEAYGTDFLTHLLTTPPIYTPGTQSAYSDAAFYLLARVAEAVSKEPLEVFLWRRLFSPLQFREAAWSKCPQGHVIGGTGLYLYTADMAKLGALYLNGGVYRGKRIFSKAWAETAVQKDYEIHPICGGKAYGKGGMQGQMLLFLPGKDRVVAWHAYEDKDLSPLLAWVCDYPG